MGKLKARISTLEYSYYSYVHFDLNVILKNVMRNTEKKCYYKKEKKEKNCVKKVLSPDPTLNLYFLCLLDPDLHFIMDTFDERDGPQSTISKFGSETLTFSWFLVARENRRRGA